MIYIFDRINKKLIESEIIPIDTKTIPLKKNGETFVLRTINSPKQIEGALQLKIEFDMLVMDALELAPHNVGQKNKRYDYVAGCLIAYACRESFKIPGNYKGYLTFISKTNLIEWYTKKYGAKLALGQRMFIDWKSGEELVEKYLCRMKNDKP